MIATDPVTNNLNAFASSGSSTTSGEIDKATFLKLLVMQLRYQDPINPMSSEDFMGQVAQFNELEQSMNLNDQFENFLAFQSLTQASSLIGKDVQAISTNGEQAELVEGTVEEVILLSGMPILKLSSGAEVSIQSVVKVSTES